MASPVVAGIDVIRCLKAVNNPADHRDRVGEVAFAVESDTELAARAAMAAVPRWSSTRVERRAAMLEDAADRLEAKMPVLLGLIIREAGKSVANAISEVREAVDFLRYYAEQARLTLTDSHCPLGPVVCISPWNFPLAIFLGQIAAALAAGNTVLAKPAEETPLIAAEAVRILHLAGIPVEAVQLIPGDGAIGAALVKRPEVAGVLFTGSTEVAKLIQMELATHDLQDGSLIPLIAETGGQNAMIVDSSALSEQVTADVIASAFDSAGQRCSALRILCLQEEIADRQLVMLKGALMELEVGNPDRLAVDVGPVITKEAKQNIDAHIERMRGLGCEVHKLPLPEAVAHGTFVAPTIIEIDDIAQIGREVFGPVLHVLRFRREEMDQLLNAINVTGYGLTFGLHTRIDETVEHVTAKAGAGNIYINRNIIGAVVGVQPFGGRGLSGTGPKAGGPLYLGRLVRTKSQIAVTGARATDPACEALIKWLESNGFDQSARDVRLASAQQLNGYTVELPGPVGEANLYALHPRGDVLLVPATQAGLTLQLGNALAAGNRATIIWSDKRPTGFNNLPQQVLERIDWLEEIPAKSKFGAILVEHRAHGMRELIASLANMAGPIPIIQVANGDGYYRPDLLIEEVSTSINTTAAGGNASLMAIV